MKNQTFRDIELAILQNTNYGFDIIYQLYPTASINKNFRIRDYQDDKTESTSMKLLEVKGVLAYRVTDFGGTVKSENCFGLYALEKNISYTEAVLEIANDLQARGFSILEKERIIYKPEYREASPSDFKYQLNEKGFHFISKDFTPFELGLLGPELRSSNNTNENGNHREALITTEICKEINLFSLEEYSFISKNKDTGIEKVITYKSTENFPILAFINEDKEIGQWLKIYKPRAGKKFTEDGKDYRFHHVGGRPKNFTFGLNRLISLLAKYRAEYNGTEDPESVKLPRISIATGGSDGLNLIALGEPVVWFNSETEQLNKYKIDELKKYADHIVNIPDCDITGIREGRKIALNYMDVKTLWLDTYFYNKNNKDFKDFCKENQSLTKKQLIKKVNDMMESAMPAKFWTSSYNEKQKRFVHNFSPTFAFYFLGLNGFCRVLDKSKKDGYYFARITGNVVEEVDIFEIKNYFKNFLVEKQKLEGVREISYSLMDSLITTNRFSENSLVMLHDKELDFTDYEQDAQYFFIGQKVFKTTRTGTSQSSFNRYVLKSQLIDELIYEATGNVLLTSKFKIEENPQFEIKEIGYNNYETIIHNGNSDFLNYMIQTSRVHWKKELDAYIKNGKKTEDFYNETKFKITSPHLSEEENQEHMNHLANKIYTFGYLLHRYKDPTKPLAPWGVDEAVMEDDVAEGGAGKTIFFSSLKYFCNFFEIPKSEDKDDKFKFEGINQHTDFVYHDDVDRAFDMKTLFSEITGGMTVNTKNVSRIKIPYSSSPKFGFTSNYSIRHNDGSYNRRRLIVAFSNYYHAANEEQGSEKREPKDDFNRRLFDDWNDEMWYSFINFGFQCLSFYLKQYRIIEAPINNVKMRTYFAEMGIHFQEWADMKIPEIVNEKVQKETLLLSCENHNKKFLSGISSAKFKKKLKAWCKVNGHEMQDRIAENVLQVNSDNAIIYKDGKPYYKTVEHLKITKIEDANNTIQEELIF